MQLFLQLNLCRYGIPSKSSPSLGPLNHELITEVVRLLNIYIFFFCVGRVLDPTSHFPPDLILYVNLVTIVFWDLGPQALQYWYSLTSLMHIVARPIDLHNFHAKYQRVVRFWVPVNYPSLNELVSMPGLWCIPSQFRLLPNTSLCKLP